MWFCVTRLERERDPADLPDQAYPARLMAAVILNLTRRCSRQPFDRRVMSAAPLNQVAKAVTRTRVLRNQLAATAAMVATVLVAMLAGVHTTFIHAVAIMGTATAVVYAPLIYRTGFRLRLALDDVLASDAKLPPLAAPIQSALRRRTDALTSMQGREQMARMLQAYARIAKKDARAPVLFTPNVAAALSHSDEVIGWIVARLRTARDVRALAALDRFLVAPREAGASADATLRQVAFLLEYDLQSRDHHPTDDAP
jgi:hypothetical protein